LCGSPYNKNRLHGNIVHLGLGEGILRVRSIGWVGTAKGAYTHWEADPV